MNNYLIQYTSGYISRTNTECVTEIYIIEYNEQKLVETFMLHYKPNDWLTNYTPKYICINELDDGAKIDWFNAKELPIHLIMRSNQS